MLKRHDYITNISDHYKLYWKLLFDRNAIGTAEGKPGGRSILEEDIDVQTHLLWCYS